MDENLFYLVHDLVCPKHDEDLFVSGSANERSLERSNFPSTDQDR